jgi:hypothetical protein
MYGWSSRHFFPRWLQRYAEWEILTLHFWLIHSTSGNGDLLIIGITLFANSQINQWTTQKKSLSRSEICCIPLFFEKSGFWHLGPSFELSWHLWARQKASKISNSPPHTLYIPDSFCTLLIVANWLGEIWMRLDRIWVNDARLGVSGLYVLLDKKAVPFIELDITAIIGAESGPLQNPPLFLGLSCRGSNLSQALSSTCRSLLIN